MMDVKARGQRILAEQIAGVLIPPNVSSLPESVRRECFRLRDTRSGRPARSLRAIPVKGFHDRERAMIPIFHGINRSDSICLLGAIGMLGRTDELRNSELPTIVNTLLG